MTLRKALMLMMSVMMVFGVPAAMAAEGAAGGHAGEFASWGSALAIGLAAFGGSLGQGKTMAAALEGIGRNPAARDKVFIPMIIGLALIESLVLYAFVIAFLIKP